MSFQYPQPPDRGYELQLNYQSFRKVPFNENDLGLGSMIWTLSTQARPYTKEDRREQGNSAESQMSYSLNSQYPP